VVIGNPQEKNWWLLYTHAWGAGVPACAFHAAQPRRGTPNGILPCVEAAVASGDANFDSKESMLGQRVGDAYNYHAALRNTAVHPTRDSLNYVPMLLEAGGEAQADRAAKIIDRVIGAQETDPAGRFCGSLGLVPGGPRAHYVARGFQLGGLQRLTATSGGNCATAPAHERGHPTRRLSRQATKCRDDVHQHGRAGNVRGAGRGTNAGWTSGCTSGLYSQQLFLAFILECCDAGLNDCQRPFWAAAFLDLTFLSALLIVGDQERFDLVKQRVADVINRGDVSVVVGVDSDG
jgi:hypothetical protein